MFPWTEESDIAWVASLCPWSQGKQQGAEPFQGSIPPYMYPSASNSVNQHLPHSPSIQSISYFTATKKVANFIPFYLFFIYLLLSETRLWIFQRFSTLGLANGISPKSLIYFDIHNHTSIFLFVLNLFRNNIKYLIIKWIKTIIQS